MVPQTKATAVEATTVRPLSGIVGGMSIDVGRATRVLALIRDELLLEADESPSLAGGAAGVALALSRLPDHLKTDHVHRGIGRLMDPALERSIARADSGSPQPGDLSLFGGVAGVAWAALAVRASASEEPEWFDEDLLDWLDDVLIAQAPFSTAYPFDVTQGLSGLLAYAARRENPSLAMQLLAGLMGAIDTVPDDVGLAHGVPGIVAATAPFVRCEHRDVAALAHDIATKGIQQLAESVLVDGANSCFPYKRSERRPSRLAWCYGDLGVAAALQRVRSVGIEVDSELLGRVATLAVNRPPEDSGVVDAGLCHGAAGVTHLMKHLALEMQNTELATSADRWLQRTLEMVGDTESDFQRRAPSMNADRGRRFSTRSRSFLEGYAGIALAISSALYPRTPTWDDCLLLSLELR